jgi:hypothetical protein
VLRREAEQNRLAGTHGAAAAVDAAAAAAQRRDGAPVASDFDDSMISLLEPLYPADDPRTPPLTAFLREYLPGSFRTRAPAAPEVLFTS